MQGALSSPLAALVIIIIIITALSVLTLLLFKHFGFLASIFQPKKRIRGDVDQREREWCESEETTGFVAKLGHCVSVDEVTPVNVDL